MGRILILTLILWAGATSTLAIRCWECSEARDDADCRAKGNLTQCMFNQDACQIEIRRHEGWGGGNYLYKHCKQSWACTNNYVQNPKSAWEPSQCNPDDINSVCRCCCYEDECNVAWDSCIARRVCGRLPTSVFRGSISCTNDNNYGSSCTVTCNSNARLVGVATTFCGTIGGWSHPIAQCAEAQCPDRGLLLNGWYICSDMNRAGSQCTAFCRPGFTLVGRKIHTCMGNTLRWNYWVPRCQPIQCPERGNVAGGIVTCSDEWNLQSRCRVECEGFRRLDGIADSYCEDKGTWSHALPVCIDIECPQRGTIVNGVVSCTLGVEVTSVCNSACDEGYGLDGVLQSTCLPTGNWDNPLPRCIRRRCAPRGLVVYGVVTCSDESFVDSTCNVVCKEGSRLIGAATSTCLATGFWDVALPTCERVICPERGEIIGGVVFCTNMRFVGSRCNARCNAGTRLIGITNSNCLASGEWSDSLPICEAIICPALDFSLQPGIMTCSNEFFYRSICSFNCEPGYIIIGAPRVSCRMNGRWTTKVPECRLVTCRNRGRLPNGVVSCSDGNSVASVCEATCNPGYEIRGLSLSNCLASGKWDLRLPSCRPIKCLLRGTLIGGTVTCTNQNFYRSVCTANCGGGRELIGARLSTCTENGEWDTPLASCISLPCPSQGTLRHGTISCSDTWNVRSVCSFTCEDEGYELYPRGRSRNVCQANQRWTIPKPCCSRPCPPYALMDIVLVLDSSSSIGEDNWVLLVDFVESIIRSFIIAPDAANFAIFRYNRDVDTTTQIFLNSFPGDVDAVIDGLRAIPYDGSGTFTGNALSHALVESLSTRRGNRPDVKDVVLVITDGKAADDVQTPADDIRASGAVILVLGIEPPRGSLDLVQLEQIAGPQENLIIARDGFGGLGASFGARLSQTICGDPCE